MPDIMHLIKIHASSDRVYQAITTAEGVRNWWTRDTNLESHVGGTGEFGFYGHRFVVNVRVQDLKPNAHVGWRMMSSGQPAFEGTSIAFDLRPAGGDTMLAFAHRGFKHADDGFASATTRWGFYLVSLKQYLESGRGTPNPDDLDL